MVQMSYLWYVGHLRTLRVSRCDPRSYSNLCYLLSCFRFGIAPSGKHKSYCIGNFPIRVVYLMPEVWPELANRAANEMAYWGQLCPSTAFIDESNFVGLMVENTHSVTTAGDLSAMANSVEVRNPFLDQEMVSFAIATPVENKIPQAKNPDWLKAITRGVAI